VFLLGQTSPACCLIITEYLCIESKVWSDIQDPLGSLLSTLVDPSLVRFHVFLGASFLSRLTFYCLSSDTFC
jgi:hypothetical protein